MTTSVERTRALMSTDAFLIELARDKRLPLMFDATQSMSRTTSPRSSKWIPSQCRWPDIHRSVARSLRAPKTSKVGKRIGNSAPPLRDTVEFPYRVTLVGSGTRR